jgi:hypothetical protein
MAKPCEAVDKKIHGTEGKLVFQRRKFLANPHCDGCVVNFLTHKYEGNYGPGTTVSTDNVLVKGECFFKNETGRMPTPEDIRVDIYTSWGHGKRPKTITPFDSNYHAKYVWNVPMNQSHRYRK